MATNRDMTLLELLDKRSAKFRSRLNTFEAGASQGLGAFFSDYETNRRFLVLAYMETLDVDENGVLLWNAANQRETAAVLKEMQAAHATGLGDDTQFARWVNKQYDSAAGMGVSFTKDVYRIGEKKRLPIGYKPPTKGVVNNASKTLMRMVSNDGLKERETLRRIALKHMVSPAGDLKSLRNDLTDSGVLEGMIDSAGRRVTASERADRIARFEFHDLATRVHQETINDIYNDGEPDPKNTFYAWRQVQRPTKDPKHTRRHGQILSEYEWEHKSWGDKQYGLAPTRPRCKCITIYVNPLWLSKDTRDEVFNAQTDTAVDELTVTT